MGFLGTLLMRLLDKNMTIPQALGFEHDGTVYLKPYAPPWYPDMATAVRAFVDSKFAPGTGIFRDAPGPSAWRDPAAVQATIPEYSERDIRAAIAYCEYVHDRYGQFPGNYGPIRTVMAFQAHHIDTAFYDAHTCREPTRTSMRRTWSAGILTARKTRLLPRPTDRPGTDPSPYLPIVTCFLRRAE
jgi:hypothetical protein